MDPALQPAKTKDDYPDILAELGNLSHDLLVTFRLQVGKLHSRQRPARLWASAGTEAQGVVRLGGSGVAHKGQRECT